MSDKFITTPLPDELKRGRTEVCVCPHCGNRCPMTVLHQHSAIGFEVIDDRVASHNYGYVYEMLECLSCEKIALQRTMWNEQDPTCGVDRLDDLKHETLHPVAYTALRGIPKSIEKEYESANLVRSNPNAYAVLAGRVLDVVCIERNAKGDSLYAKIEDLSKREIVPKSLAEVAHGIRALRNTGAHADLGNLSQSEVATLEVLLSALLEYVYVAPSLVEKAQSLLSAIKSPTGKP